MQRHIEKQNTKFKYYLLASCISYSFTIFFCFPLKYCESTCLRKKQCKISICKTKKALIYGTKLLFWVFLGCNFRKPKSYLKSASLNYLE